MPPQSIKSNPIQRLNTAARLDQRHLNVGSLKTCVDVVWNTTREIICAHMNTRAPFLNPVYMPPEISFGGTGLARLVAID